MLAEVYENTFEKKKKGLLEKSILLTGKLAGGGIGSIAGTLVATGYAISKEASSLVTTQQLYPLQQLGLEYFSIIGGFSLTSSFVGYYLSKKFLDFIS
jgi:hypothetical protein